MTDTMKMAGFCELSDNEMVTVDGGSNSGTYWGGVAVIFGCTFLAFAAPEVGFPLLFTAGTTAFMASMSAA